ncbi:MAG: hypothetical protein KGL39_41365 [Patescibacteria group bacterium]|nr:hypothetical protein [Patescibacteria group bacterium]
MHNLFKNVKTVRLKPDGTNWQVAAGTTDTLTSNALDTEGYDGVAVMFVFGAVSATAVGTPKLQYSTDNNNDYVDVNASHQTIGATDTEKIVITEIFRPTQRYIESVITRATANIAVDAVIAFLFRAEYAAVDQDATIAGTLFMNAPASGTA